jgi:hypothetical protein
MFAHVLFLLYISKYGCTAKIPASLAISYSFAWLYPVIMAVGGGIMLVEEFIATRLETSGLRASTEEETSVSEGVNLDIHDEDQETEEEEKLEAAESPIVFFKIIFLSAGLISAIILRSLSNRPAQVFGAFYTVGTPSLL